MSLAEARLEFLPTIPDLLKNGKLIALKEEKREPLSPEIAKLFPQTAKSPLLRFATKKAGERVASLTVGVLFSGGQAPGGHNVIAGLFDALEACVERPTLIGFLGGPSGLEMNRTTRLTKETIAACRNQGGFDLLGSGRTKIEKEDQLKAALATVQAHNLDAVVIIGGDDSNTNAAVLAEYFLKEGAKTVVIGVPKTIDGDLKTDYIEISFGFDTATKIYSELIGNIARDALSAKKYYHFIKLMGRSASHIALECALRCKPNMTLISEEVHAKKQGLKEIKAALLEIIQMRAEMGKNYGVILLPEGLIEFIPELKTLIDEINGGKTLSTKSAHVLKQLPDSIQKQMMADRDPHGNVHVSGIDTEELLIALIKDEVAISPVSHFLGYEGRSALPSNFDSNYCYALGRVAAALALARATGYIAAITGLSRPPAEWQPYGIPIVSMLTLETRKGALKPVIKKALVDLKGPLFKQFAAARSSWLLADHYQYPGPIQFFGPSHITDSVPLSLMQH